MLIYKGYIGTIDFDSGGKIFIGEVIGIHSVITFEGRTPDQLETSFHKSIDLYLQMCTEDHISPDKPSSRHFNVRIPPDLYHEIAIRAEIEHKSINDWVTKTLENAVKS
jgi:predicted HicB family RNase H-like nuclease